MSESLPQSQIDQLNSEMGDSSIQTTWNITFVHKNLTRNDKKDEGVWSTAIRKIASFNKLGEAKFILNNIPKPRDWPVNSNLQVFREGINPAWEDPNNLGVGRLCIKIECDIDDKGNISLPGFLKEQNLITNKKENTNEVLAEIIDGLFENILYYIVCENFPDYSDIVNGFVYSPRRINPRIFIWLRNDDCFQNKASDFQQCLFKYLNDNNSFNYTIDGTKHQLKTTVTYEKLDESDNKNSRIHR